jgi:hypothetical protein
VVTAASSARFNYPHIERLHRAPLVNLGRYAWTGSAPVSVVNLWIRCYLNFRSVIRTRCRKYTGCDLHVPLSAASSKAIFDMTTPRIVNGDKLALNYADQSSSICVDLSVR